MTRYADDDHRLYAKLFDCSIVIGAVTILIHLVTGVPTPVLSFIVGMMLAMTAVGLYFKLRSKDAPGSADRLV